MTGAKGDMMTVWRACALMMGLMLGAAGAWSAAAGEPVRVTYSGFQTGDLVRGADGAWTEHNGQIPPGGRVWRPVSASGPDRILLRDGDDFLELDLAAGRVNYAGPGRAGYPAPSWLYSITAVQRAFDPLPYFVSYSGSQTGSLLRGADGVWVEQNPGMPPGGRRWREASREPKRVTLRDGEATLELDLTASMVKLASPGWGSWPTPSPLYAITGVRLAEPGASPVAVPVAITPVAIIPVATMPVAAMPVAAGPAASSTAMAGSLFMLCAARDAAAVWHVSRLFSVRDNAVWAPAFIQAMKSEPKATSVGTYNVEDMVGQWDTAVEATPEGRNAFCQMANNAAALVAWYADMKSRPGGIDATLFAGWSPAKGNAVIEAARLDGVAAVAPTNWWFCYAGDAASRRSVFSRIAPLQIDPTSENSGRLDRAFKAWAAQAYGAAMDRGSGCVVDKTEAVALSDLAEVRSRAAAAGEGVVDADWSPR